MQPLLPIPLRVVIQNQSIEVGLRLLLYFCQMLLTIIIIQSYPIILYVGPESVNPCWFNVLCLIQMSPQWVHVSVVVHAKHTLVAEMEKDWNKANKK